MDQFNRVFRIISVILISTFFSLNVFAQINSSCKTVDESKSPYIGPMDDQGDYNTCYAFVASYLVGHYLKTEINPEHIAVRYEHYVDQSSASTVKEMLTQGLGQVANAINTQASYGFLKECAANSTAKLETSLDPLSYLKLLEKNCKLVKANISAVRNSVEDVGRDHAARTLDELLDRGQIAAVFGTPRFFRGFEAADGDWYHVMTLVGRRFNPTTQSCEYVLRNTRGPNVQVGMTVHGPYNYRYENGHFIVSRDYLKDFMSGIYYIKSN